MPTVLTLFGLRVVIYPNDHRPAHVHVCGNGCEATFNLSCPDGPVVTRANYGFAKSDIARISSALNGNLAQLCGDWGRIHGTF
jgi:hypothetical protein